MDKPIADDNEQKLATELTDKRYRHSDNVLFSQSEAQYTTIGRGKKICANCRFYMGDYQPCLIVKNDDPYPIVPSGGCAEYRDYPVTEPMPTVIQVSSDVTPTGETFLTFSEVAQAARTVDTLIKTLAHGRTPTRPPAYAQGFKLLDDNRWLGWWSNNFLDREIEIISEKALKSFIDAANKGNVPMPELWWMHIAGTKHGIAERLFKVGHFAVAVGAFDNETENPFVTRMKQWYADNQNVTMSHGFWYDKSQYQKLNNGVGVYHHILTYEISSLIGGYEANQLTAFMYPDERSKMSTVDKQTYQTLETSLGKEWADFITQRATQLGADTRNAGVDFKALFGGKAVMKPPTDEEDEDEDEKEGNKKPPAKKPPFKSVEGIDPNTLIILAGLQKMSEDIQSTLQGVDSKMQSGTDETNKQTNVWSDFQGQLDDINANVQRMNKTFLDLTRRQPSASKSSATVVDENNPQVRFLAEQNNNRQGDGETGERRKSILEQMQDYGDMTPPNYPNGHSD